MTDLPVDGEPAPRVHHLAFRTDDVARLAAFYRWVIGLSPAPRQAATDRVWLEASGVLVMIEPRAPGEPAVPAGVGDMVAFAVAAGSRTRHLERLAAAGVTVESATAFTLYVRDPDGRRVGLSAYPEPL